MKASFSSASASRLSGETSKSFTTGGTSLTRNGLKNFGKNKKCDVTRSSSFEFSEHIEDPFAFEEDECEPSKWEVPSGKKVPSRNKTNTLAFGQTDPVSQLQQQLGLWVFDDEQQSLPESSTSQQTEEISDSRATDEEHCSLIADCLLSAVKVLMNLTNDNPVGCRQIAACGGLESMVSVIACHYPSFGSNSSSLSFCEIQEYSIKFEFEEVKPNKQQFSDQEMDLLVAILGLLVNLVEKDDSNRSCLATCRVSPGNSTQCGSDYEGYYKEVIPLLCSVFLVHRTESETVGEEVENLDAEEMILQGEKEAEKKIVESYAALLLAFLSTQHYFVLVIELLVICFVRNLFCLLNFFSLIVDSKTTGRAITACLPNHKLSTLIPVLEKLWHST